MVRLDVRFALGGRYVEESDSIGVIAEPDLRPVKFLNPSDATRTFAKRNTPARAGSSSAAAFCGHVLVGQARHSTPGDSDAKTLALICNLAIA